MLLASLSTLIHSWWLWQCSLPTRGQSRGLAASQGLWCWPFSCCTCAGRTLDSSAWAWWVLFLLASFRCWTVQVPVLGSIFWYEALRLNDKPHGDLLVKLDEPVRYWLVDKSSARSVELDASQRCGLGFVSDLLRRVADQQSMDFEVRRLRKHNMWL